MPVRCLPLLSRLLLIVCLGAAAFACGEKSKKAERDGGVLPDGAVAPSGQLPGGYIPRIACGNLGNTCETQQECGGGLICKGGNCMPEDTSDCADGCPKSAPVCASSWCVDVDVLGCLCLNEDSRFFPNCEPITDDPPSQCLQVDSLCDTRVDDCCRGTSCIQGKDASGDQLLGLCKDACDDGGDCETGCCIQVESLGQKFCADREACIGRCRNRDEECDGEFRPCCEGFVCAASPADPALNGCKPACSRNDECDTGCCVLFTDMHGIPTDNGVCAPADRCVTP
jgi:hypothetical protein